MSDKQTARFGSVIFCLGASSDEKGKINCRGVFTSHLAWGYPTSFRTWHAILTLYDLPHGTTSISVAISHGRGIKSTLASCDVESGKEDLGATVNIPLVYQFVKEGFYDIHFNIIGTSKTLKVPLKISTQKWPEFTKKEIDFAKKNAHKIVPIRTNLTCAGCSRPYVFEESIIKDQKLADGVLQFPDDGIFECESCGRALHLKDIQGMIRSSIKTSLLSII